MQQSDYSSTTIEEKQRGSQKRVYSLIVLLIFSLLIVFVALITPLLLMRNSDSRERAHLSQLEFDLAESWANKFRTDIIDAISAANLLEGFVTSEMEIMPPFNGTVQERLEGQKFPRFPLVANMTTLDMESVVMQMLSPGGVVLETFPVDTFLYEFDTLNLPSFLPLHVPDPLETIDTGRVAIIGPALSQIPLLNGTWCMDVRNPVYNASSIANISRDNFWGFVTVVLNVSYIIEQNNLSQVMQSEGMDYLLYGNYTNGTIYVVSTSLQDQSPQALLSFIIAGRGGMSFISNVSFSIVVHTSMTWGCMTHGNITIVVVCAVAGALGIFMIGVWFILCATNEYDGRPYAPKRTPFAMLTIGPCHGEDFWNIAAEPMAEVTEDLNFILDARMQDFHAYKIQQMHPYTSSYVTRSVDAAVHMAFSIIEHLQKHSIDGPLKRLLGEDGQLLLSCAVNWCTDVTVSVGSSGKSYRYEGTDVLYGGRMWVFAAPNTVTLSAHAHHVVVRQMAHVSTAYLKTVSLVGTGEENSQKLYTATDPSSKHLRKAQVAANAFMARGPSERHRFSAWNAINCAAPSSRNISPSITTLQLCKSDDGSTQQQQNLHQWTSQRRLSPGHIPVRERSFHNSSKLSGTIEKEGRGSPATAPPLSPTSPSRTFHSIAYPVGGLHSHTEEEEQQQRRSLQLDALSDGQSSSLLVSPQGGSGATNTPNTTMLHQAPQPPSGSPNVVSAVRSSLLLEAAASTNPAADGVNAHADPRSGVCRPSFTVDPSAPSAVLAPPPAASAAPVRSNGENEPAFHNAPIIGRVLGRRRAGVKRRSTTIAVAGEGLIRVEHESTNGAAEMRRNAGASDSHLRDTDHHPLPRAVATANTATTASDASTNSAAVTGTATGASSHPLSLPEGDAVTNLLLHPAIPAYIDSALRAAFVRQAMALDVRYESVRVMVYYFYSGYKLLFRPLAAPERNNIFNRFITAFGVPQQNIIDHLACSCTIRYIQEKNESNVTPWEHQATAAGPQHRHSGRHSSAAHGAHHNISTVNSSN